MMLIDPAGLQQLAHASTQYSQLGISTWGKGNQLIEYGSWSGTTSSGIGRTGTFAPGYDANCSVTKKITWNTQGNADPADDAIEEEVSYQYNLQNRLELITREYDSAGDKIEEFTRYAYNDSGIRVSKHTWSEINDTHQNDDVTIVYLVDSYNPTGYAQTLEELTFDKADPVVGTDTPDSMRTYLIGDDVIAQTTGGNTQYLLYDGHGSTRQLAEYDGSAVTIADNYSYDGYGVLLQDEDNFPNTGTQTPGKVAEQDTSLLYAGEHFDTDSQQYYLRARWYDALSGRFNQMDPYAGNSSDPQSLHKYLYCHADPVNRIDPSGNLSIGRVIVGIAIVALLVGILWGYSRFINRDWEVETGHTSLRIAIVYASNAVWQFNLAHSSPAGLASQLRTGGHQVDTIIDPDEDRFAEVLNNSEYNILLIIAHGAGEIASSGNVEDLRDLKNQKFAAFLLSGTDCHNDDGKISDSFIPADYSGSRNAFITANEVAQRVPNGAANKNLEVAAAACSQGNSSRWHEVMGSRVYVGFKEPVIPFVASHAIQYVVNRANGVPITDAINTFRNNADKGVVYIRP